MNRRTIAILASLVAAVTGIVMAPNSQWCAIECRLHGPAAVYLQRGDAQYYSHYGQLREYEWPNL